MASSPAARALRGYARCSARLEARAIQALGSRNWSLVSRYGRVMNGEHSGHYFSALPHRYALKLVRALAGGDSVSVHLMHRHVSGCYESSRLLLRAERLWMLFDDRSEMAWLPGSAPPRT